MGGIVKVSTEPAGTVRTLFVIICDDMQILRIRKPRDDESFLWGGYELFYTTGKPMNFMASSSE